MKLTLVTCCLLLALLPGVALGQQEGSLTDSFRQFEKESEQEFGPASCDGLMDTAGGAVELLCRQYSSAPDRRSFFAHLEGCKLQFPDERYLWQYCVRKAEIDEDLLSDCASKVSLEAGVPTKDKGPLAEAWWSLINQCMRHVWAQLFSVEPLKGLGERAKKKQ